MIGARIFTCRARNRGGGCPIPAAHSRCSKCAVKGAARHFMMGPRPTLDGSPSADIPAFIGTGEQWIQSGTTEQEHIGLHFNAVFPNPVSGGSAAEVQSGGRERHRNARTSGHPLRADPAGNQNAKTVHENHAVAQNSAMNSCEKQKQKHATAEPLPRLETSHAVTTRPSHEGVARQKRHRRQGRNRSQIGLP
jgi:hypothetical protein